MDKIEGACADDFSSFFKAMLAEMERHKPVKGDYPFVLSQYAFKVAMIFKHLQVTMLYTSGSPGLGCNIACSDLFCLRRRPIYQRNAQAQSSPDAKHCQSDDQKAMADLVDLANCCAMVWTRLKAEAEKHESHS